MTEGHPRACGEHTARFAAISAASGSSPRVRGACKGVQGMAGPHGVIPARAGSMQAIVRFQWLYWGHPRACGEHLENENAKLRELGSSPRVRGACNAVTYGATGNRVIPARAGSIIASVIYEPCFGGHPRACGEHRVPQPGGLLPAGSSPRVRGASHPFFPALILARVIPARAGSICAFTSSVNRPKGHPRACGEHGAPAKEGE